MVNRLCSDVYTVDDALPFQLNICLASLVNLMGALLITAIALPFLLPLIVALLAIYYFIQARVFYSLCIGFVAFAFLALLSLCEL